MREIILLVSVGLLPIGAQSPGTPGGTVSGSVSGDDGTSINGTITLRKVTTKSRSRVPSQVEWRAKLDGKGGFTFPLVPFGEYLACVRAAEHSWLDPCEWDSKIPSVLVSGSRTSANLSVILKKGTAVDVRIDDPAGLLSQNEAKTAGAGLLVAVASDGLLMHIIPVYGRTNASRSYRLFVPPQTPHRLIVQSTFYKLADTSGLPLRETAATVIPFTPAGGRPLPVTTFTITGSKR